MPFVIVLLFFAQSQVSGKQLAASKDHLLADYEGEARTTVEEEARIQEFFIYLTLELYY